MHYSILTPEFDPSLLIDSSLNTPFDSDRDIFYNSLLKDINDPKLYNSVLEIWNNRTSLNNFSHVNYLLPWSHQPPPPPASSGNTERSNKNIKQNLLNYIGNVKRLSLVSSYLLGLRLTGFSGRSDLLYRRLGEIYRQNIPITVVCKINRSLVTHRGQLILFDIDLNLLIFDQAFTFIKLVPSSHFTQSQCHSLNHLLTFILTH